jgi:DNA recombination protein RmuC
MASAALAIVACLAIGMSIAALLLGRALISAKTRLELEIGRRDDQNALNEAEARVLAAQRETLKNEFAALAAKLLDEKGQSLAAANEKSVGVLFRQLQERLLKYEAEVEKATGENTKLGEHMKTQLAALQNFADRAQAFTAALVGGNKIQGNKGEEILAGILEKSGFRKGREYDTQLGAAGEGRPDASIYDAMNSRIILVDAKMNIKDYISACGLPADDAHKAERERLFKAHAASVRRQIDSLASKNYAETVAPTREGYANLPLVAMFCPFEAILETALEYDPALVQYAYERKIVLVTPLTLWGYLWLVSWGWRQKAVEKRFDEIQAMGKEVVSALDSLVNDIETMGEMLGKAEAAYESLRKRAIGEKGQTSVRRVAKKLMDCGVVPSGKLKRLGRFGDGEDAE